MINSTATTDLSAVINAKPIINKGGCNLSFAGLKTAILRITKAIKTEQEKFDLAASFQKTIEEILYEKTKVAFDEFKKVNSQDKTSFVVAGGVASNKFLRKNLKKFATINNSKLIVPSKNLCTDNAAMIALVAIEKFKKNKINNFNFQPLPNWHI